MTYARLLRPDRSPVRKFGRPGAGGRCRLSRRVPASGLRRRPGMTASRNFSGFEDRDKRVALVIVGAAGGRLSRYREDDHARLAAEAGHDTRTREEVAHPLGKAMLFLGHQQIEGQRIRKWILVVAAGDLTALVTVQVPEAAQSGLSRCRNPRRADERGGAADRPGRRAIEPAAVPCQRACRLQGRRRDRRPRGDAHRWRDRDNPPKPSTPTSWSPLRRAHRAGVRSRPLRARSVRRRAQPEGLRINSSEPLRIGGQQGHQIMARGRDGATGDEVTIVQWLRFGGSAYLHLVGVARFGRLDAGLCPLPAGARRHRAAARNCALIAIQNSRDAMRAPSAIAANFAHTTSGSTAAWPTQVP